MSRFTYTPAMVRFLEREYQHMHVADLAVAFNRKFRTDQSKLAIKSALSNRRITCGRKTGQRVSGEAPRRLLDSEQDRWLRRAYQCWPAREVARRLNRLFETSFEPSQIVSYIHRYGINCQRDGRFKRGQPRTPGSGAKRAGPTSFRKGHIPKNIRPLYSERVCSKSGQIQIKVPEPNPYTGAPTRFIYKAVWVWQQAYGPVPKGHNVVLIDGDRDNVVLDNLALVTDAELCHLNKHLEWRKAPVEVRETLIALARVERKQYQLMRR